MPAQLFHARDLPDEQANSEARQAECPAWITDFFKTTARYGAMFSTPILVYTLIAGTFYGNRALLYGCFVPVGNTHLPGSMPLLLGLLVLWRQNWLKRWACVTACVVAWGIAFTGASILWNASYFHPVGPFDAVWCLLLIITAPVMTYGCIAGWRWFEAGF